jgi:anti-sigma B factor antagonist
MSDLEQAGDGVLAVKSERLGDTMVVSLIGEADLFTAPTVEDHLRGALASDAERVIVDLGELEFIDSMSLRILLKAELAAREESRRLFFLPGRPQVERVLRVSGIKAQLRFLER